MTIKTIEATINAQIADLEEALQSNIKTMIQTESKAASLQL